MSRVTLRPASRGDRADLVTANKSSRDHHAPWVQPFTDDAGFAAWFAQTITGATVSLVARASLNGDIVGVFNISQIVLGPFRSAYLGFYGMAHAAGAGFMTDALQQTCAHAFTAIGLHRLEANIQPDNAKSLALAARCGFQKEGFSPRYLNIAGIWRDHERWARLADD